MCFKHTLLIAKLIYLHAVFREMEGAKMNTKQSTCQCLKQNTKCKCVKTNAGYVCRPHSQRGQCQSPFEMFGVQAQLTKVETVYLEDQQSIVFDQIIKNHHQLITYNSETGYFTLKKAGNYLINWDVSVEGSYSKPFIKLSLIANEVIMSSSTLPVTVGQLSGTRILFVRCGPVEVALINDTGEVIQLSEFSPVANITITKIQHT